MKNKKNELDIIQFRCDKCNKLQKKDDKQSNKNWSVFNVGEKCVCGGEYKIFIYGVETKNPALEIGLTRF